MPYTGNCSAWLRLKLTTNLGFKHPPTTTHPPPGRFSKSSRLSNRLRFGMYVSLRIRSVLQKALVIFKNLSARFYLFYKIHSPKTL